MFNEAETEVDPDEDAGAGQKLVPLMDQMRLDALTEDVLHADETTVQVLKEPDRRVDQTSYMWV
ncbi:MAG: hypothetical protein ACJAYE_002820 [Candidatus Azotimanducaceae bacterium]